MTGDPNAECSGQLTTSARADPPEEGRSLTGPPPGSPLD
jgi:hypothetical protein